MTVPGRPDHRGEAGAGRPGGTGAGGRGGRRPRRRSSGADRGPLPLGDALDDVLAGLVPPSVAADASRGAGPPTADALSAVFTRWEEIVGPAVARHVRPVRFSGGVLVVAVDQPAWATQVRALGSGLLARVGELGGVVPDRLQVTVRPALPEP